MAEWVGVNASPLIVLAKVRRLDLLAAAGDRLVTTQAAMQEIAAAGRADPAYLSLKALATLAVVGGRRRRAINGGRCPNFAAVAR